ncbi:MAG TPA: hypothetical protein VEZ48_01530 [Sphingomonadaceae bacterium]|nr:hypothetical protein [Sphingomonadaceae bacterium]
MTRPWSNPRSTGLVCAAGAVGLGLAYMAMAGAPTRYLGMNLAALAIGLAAFAATARYVRQAGGLPAAVTLALGAALLASALFGITVEGATRWLRVGSVVLQPSLMVVPLLTVAFMRQRGAMAACGMGLAALALAIQPDRAMAGVLAAGLTAVAVARRDRRSVAALLAAVAAFAVALLRPDALPAVPFVDQVFYNAFGVHPLAGLAVAGGAALLLAPALTGRAGERDLCAVFAAVWIAVIAAAALGNYPTPLVGYGGSAILGYLLSVSLLPGAGGSRVGAKRGSADAVPSGPTDQGGDPRTMAPGAPIRAAAGPAWGTGGV